MPDPRKKRAIDAPKKETSQLRSAENESFLSKAKDISLNPLTAFGYAARGENIPGRLGRGIKSGAIKRNELDNPLDLVNPAFYMESFRKGSTSFLKGSIKEAAGEALNFVPAFNGAVSGTGRLARNERILGKMINYPMNVDNLLQFTKGKGIINDDKKDENSRNRSFLKNKK